MEFEQTFPLQWKSSYYGWLEYSQEEEQTAAAAVEVEVVATADTVEVAFLSAADPFAAVVEHIDQELPVQEEHHIVPIVNLKELVRILSLDSVNIGVVETVVVAVAVEEAEDILFAEVFDMEIDSLVDLEAAAVPSSCCTSLGSVRSLGGKNRISKE